MTEIYNFHDGSKIEASDLQHIELSKRISVLLNENSLVRYKEFVYNDREFLGLFNDHYCGWTVKELKLLLRYRFLDQFELAMRDILDGLLLSSM